MPPKKKFRSGRAKKRRLTWNKYIRQKNLQVKKAIVQQESIERSDESDLFQLDETDNPPSSSDNKSSHVLPRKPDELFNMRLKLKLLQARMIPLQYKVSGL